MNEYVFGLLGGVMRGMVRTMPDGPAKATVLQAIANTEAHMVEQYRTFWVLMTEEQRLLARDMISSLAPPGETRDQLKSFVEDVSRDAKLAN